MEWRIVRLKETGSTNQDAMEAGRSGEPEGLAVTAELQTAGRGRMGRNWFSPPGRGIYCSALLRPRISPEQAGLLSFCAANAMVSALGQAGFDARTKWPNDVLCGGHKVCGILSACDTSGGGLRFAVVGSGLNLYRGSYPEELKDRAACLEEFGDVPDRETLLLSYLRELDREVTELEARGFEPVRRRFEEKCLLAGRPVRVLGSCEADGIMRGIGPAGELMLETENGEIRPFLTGDVSVRGVNGYV